MPARHQSLHTFTRLKQVDFTAIRSVWRACDGLGETLWQKSCRSRYLRHQRCRQGHSHQRCRLVSVAAACAWCCGSQHGETAYDRCRTSRSTSALESCEVKGNYLSGKKADWQLDATIDHMSQNWKGRAAYVVVINDRMTAADHVSNLLETCTRRLYALRVLRHHGLARMSMNDVFRATVLAKVLGLVWLLFRGRQRKIWRVRTPLRTTTLQRRRLSSSGGNIRERRYGSDQQNRRKRQACAAALPTRSLPNKVQFETAAA